LLVGVRGRMSQELKNQRMNHLFPILTALAYLSSFGLYVRFLATGKKLTGRLGTLLLGLGLVAHYFALLERSRGLHTVPLP